MMAVAPYLRPVLEAPLKIAGGVNTLGRALWLYEALVLRASDQGTIVRARQRLAEDLSVSTAEIDTWLKRLLDAKLIDLQSPSNFLVISLRFWPRSGVVGGNVKGVQAADSGMDEAPAEATASASKQAILLKSKLSAPFHKFADICRLGRIGSSWPDVGGEYVTELSDWSTKQARG